MMPPDALQIIKQYDDARYNPDLSTTRLIRVVYMVGKHGPFTEDFDKATFTAATRDARLQQLAREIWIEPR